MIYALFKLLSLLRLPKINDKNVAAYQRDIEYYTSDAHDWQRRNG